MKTTCCYAFKMHAWWWLQAFFPSWKFFDVVGAELVLEARVGNDERTLGAWRACVPPVQRSLARALFNPRGNATHAFNNLLNRLVIEINAGEDIGRSVNYRLLQQLARHQLARLGHSGAVLQLRLRVRDNGGDADVLLLSPVVAA